MAESEQEIERMQRTEEAIVVATGAARERGCEGNSTSLRSCRQFAVSSDGQRSAAAPQTLWRS
jgi:hypothetical protein